MININMKTYYKKTYKGILPAAVIACTLGTPVSIFLNLGGWLGFALKACIYVLIYLAAIYFIGFNKEEKQGINRLVGKFIKKT